MKEAVRGNRIGLVSLCVMVLGFLMLVVSVATGIGFDVYDGAPVLILYVVSPLGAVAVVIAVIGLFADRKRVFSGLSLALIPAAVAAAWFTGRIGR